MAMREGAHNPFDNLESAYEYVRLLEEAIEEARGTIELDTREAQQDGAARRLQALQIVSYKLNALNDHMRASRRLLNDLRTLRRMLLGERDTVRVRQPQPQVGAAPPLGIGAGDRTRDVEPGNR